MAGTVAVALHDRLAELGWIVPKPRADRDYTVTDAGTAALAALGIDVDRARSQRRRFAFACLDWSERRAHLGGALGAALLDLAVRRRWVTRELDGRALNVTPSGRRELQARFGVPA
jgi:hypothetical protein